MNPRISTLFFSSEPKEKRKRLTEQSHPGGPIPITSPSKQATCTYEIPLQKSKLSNIPRNVLRNKILPPSNRSLLFLKTGFSNGIQGACFRPKF
ncbi:hypothetical protein CEXT_774621 [Caerostris extrusa]|uniref:Uncharacterized protein n=1 Tax=Caerostris extrusa TaxID=172846 RepID=A0AAV4VHW8_CAEEX|nr:hypothetical protein CEXT_774621 [Caerostris extrusa]